MNARRHARFTVVAALALAAVGAAIPGCAGSTATNGSAGSGGFNGGTGSGGTTSVGTGGSVGVTDGGVDGGNLGSGGHTGTGGSGTGGSSATGGAPGCAVTLTAVSAPSFDALEAGPTARFRVRADVARAGPSTPVWTWNVTFGGGPQTTVPVTRINTTSPTQSQIEFPIADPGSYDIQVRVDSGTTCPPAERIAVAHPPSAATFIFRITPPALSNLMVPIQDLRIPLPGAGPFAMTLGLTPGAQVSVAPQDSFGQYIPAYVRVSSVSTGSATEGNTARGPFTALVLPLATYDILVVPDGDVAPQLLSTPPALPNPLPMDPGIAVTGSARDANGVAVSGVRVVLREGARPSTVGVSASDGTGQFSLLTRAGALSAVIAPPLGSGLPEAHVGPGAGAVGSAAAPIALDASMATVDLAMIWNPIARAALTLTVTGSDGATPVAGAEVRIESQAELPSVGTLVLRAPGLAPVSLPASGSARADVFADASGTVRFPILPTGSYVVTAAAPQSLPNLAPTGTTVTLGGAGLVARLALATPVNLTGTLLASSDPAGVHVLARDLSGALGADTVSTVAGAGGAFSVPVAPGRAYQLVADPPVGSRLARTVFATVDVGAGDTSVGSLTVSPGVAFTGTARILGGAALGGAVVQILCTGSGPTCVDPTVPVAEAVTASDGTFTVQLPIVSP